MRETCAQALGVGIQHLDVQGVQSVIAALLQLLTQKQWEVRHGGLLGLKYLLAIRQVSAVRQCNLANQHLHFSVYMYNAHVCLPIAYYIRYLSYL